MLEVSQPADVRMLGKWHLQGLIGIYSYMPVIDVLRMAFYRVIICHYKIQNRLDFELLV